MRRRGPAGDGLRARPRLVSPPLALQLPALLLGLGLARHPAGASGDVLSPPPAGSPAGSVWSVPLDDRFDGPVYEDLEYFRARGDWAGGPGALPWTRAECALALEMIRASAGRRGTAGSIGAGGSSGGDAARMRRLERRVESWGLAPPPTIPGTAGEADGRARLARWEVRAAVQTHMVAADLDSLADLDRRPRREQLLCLSADAALGRHLYAQFRFTEDYTAQTPYRRGRGWADNLPSAFRRAFTDATARNDRAILGYGWSWGDARLGREDRRWGAGRRGALVLSESPFPLDGISLRARTRRFAATSLFAQLRRGGRNLGVDTTAVDPRGDGDAWMAAHRFEARPWPSLCLGLSEAVAYGGRGLDLGYLNPVALLAAVTQDLDNRAGVDDKKVLGLDLSASLPPVTLYGEFLFNRVVSLDSATRGDSTQISSYAQLVGAQWSDPAGWRGADLRVEYAHLDPEVYFHHDRDPGRALLHQGELIGHWLGPNADDLTLSLTVPPHERWGNLALGYEQSRWGRINGLRGVDLGFAGLVRREKRWITGRREVERTLSVDWRRLDLAGPFGTRFEGAVRVARVERRGPRNERGWQAEARITWRGSAAFWEAGWP